MRSIWIFFMDIRLTFRSIIEYFFNVPKEMDISKYDSLSAMSINVVLFKNLSISITYWSTLYETIPLRIL